ncbi:MAG: adenylate cyclase, partial [Gammaproteobacteria bacterium]
DTAADPRSKEIRSDFQELTGIFESRLSTEYSESTRSRASGLTTDERAALIGRFAHILRRLSELMNISAEPERVSSLDDVLARLMDIVTESLGADRSTLFLHDRSSGQLFSRVAQGGLIDEIRLSPAEGIAGAVFRSQKPIIIDDAYSDPRFNQEVDRRTGYHTNNILCVPVRGWDGQVFGVTQVLNKRQGPFSSEDCALLEALTSHASTMLENARLNESIEKAQRDEQQLLGVTQALTSELHLDALLQRVVFITTDVLEAERSSLFLHDELTDELWTKVAEGLDAHVIRIPSDVGLAGSVFSSGEVVNIPDAYADPRFNPEVDKRTGFRTRSILCMPIVNKEGHRLGVIQVLNRRAGPFGKRDERRLQALTAQAAVALDNARLFENVLAERNYNERILESLSNGVLTLDANSNVLTTNDGARRILHCAPDDIARRPMHTLFDDRSGRIATAIQRVIKVREADYLAELDLELGDGTRIAANVVVSPMDEAPGQPPRYLMILDDISDAKRLRNTMARYMPHEIVEQMLNEADTVLGGATQRVTILFADISGFTEMSERIGARETVTMLNDYFSEMTDVILRHNGIVDKFIGDAIMAVFGAPYPREGDADNALKVASEMTLTLEQFNARRIAAGQDPINVRIGISSGEVVAGNIGSPKRMDYTVIGDGVNIAARLESANKTYATRILLSESTYAELSERKSIRLIDRVRVKGTRSPIDIYELHPPRSQLHLEAFRQGVELYRGEHWEQAQRTFTTALALAPTDGPSAHYLSRLEERSAPYPHWDGIYEPTDN